MRKLAVALLGVFIILLISCEPKPEVTATSQLTGVVTEQKFDQYYKSLLSWKMVGVYHTYIYGDKATNIRKETDGVIKLRVLGEIGEHTISDEELFYTSKERDEIKIQFDEKGYIIAIDNFTTGWNIYYLEELQKEK